MSNQMELDYWFSWFLCVVVVVFGKNDEPIRCVNGEIHDRKHWGLLISWLCHSWFFFLLLIFSPICAEYKSFSFHVFCVESGDFVWIFQSSCFYCAIRSLVGREVDVWMEKSMNSNSWGWLIFWFCHSYLNFLFF